jgi:hypothetical protein
MTGSTGRIRLVALDLDGTLLDSAGRLPLANATAVAEVVASGVEVVVVTGRRFGFARHILDDLPGVRTLIASNGALTKDRHGTTLAGRPLPRAVAARVIDDAVAYRADAAVVFDRPRERQVVFERIDWTDPRRRAYFEWNRDYIDQVSPLTAALIEDPVQLMYTGDVRAMRNLLSVLDALAYRADFAVALTEYVDRDFALVDVVRRGCSKAAALAEWAARLGVSRGEVLAVGDNHNDCEMLDFAGHGVVMGNAAPELREGRWAVTATNDEAGVAAALIAFVLGDWRTG